MYGHRVARVSAACPNASLRGGRAPDGGVAATDVLWWFFHLQLQLQIRDSHRIPTLD